MRILPEAVAQAKLLAPVGPVQQFAEAIAALGYTGGMISAARTRQ